MYMNKTKRNLIIAAAILGLVDTLINLATAIVYKLKPEIFQEYLKYISFDQVSVNLIYQIISCCIAVVGSILLFYCVREKGKYYRQSRGIYVAGVIITILTTGLIPWILLLIAAFQPDIIINNSPQEFREQSEANAREEVLHNEEYELKKRKIEELKALRDSGAITEEEYKQKLFDLL